MQRPCFLTGLGSMESCACEATIVVEYVLRSCWTDI